MLFILYLMAQFTELRKKSIKLAKKAVRDSVNADWYIINALNVLEELSFTIHTYTKRLKDWYALYFPELQRMVSDTNPYVELILKNDKNKLLKEYGISDSMGGDMKTKDIEPIIQLSKIIKSMIDEKNHLETYIEETMKNHCPNFLAVATPIIGAKLIRGAGSIKNLALMRSSTIQLLGAEKALFRHIKTGSKSPKFGIIAAHELVVKADSKNKGKVARSIADKLFILARVDYFKGAFIGDKIRSELEVKFS